MEKWLGKTERLSTHYEDLLLQGQKPAKSQLNPAVSHRSQACYSPTGGVAKAPKASIPAAAKKKQLLAWTKHR